MIPEDPQQAVTLIDSLSRLGVVAFFVIFSGLVLRRQLITMGEKRDSDAVADARLAELRAATEARLAEMRHDRDEWKSIAKSMTARMDRMTGVLEKVTGVHVPPDPDRL